MANPFDPAFEDLPDVVPIFPLAGVLLLPGGRLPLNVFEPRYLNMTAAALAAPQRLIGMIQPQDGATGDHPEVFATGCAGRMTSFDETEDGRYLITLKGIARFRVIDELPLRDGYRRVRASYAEFRDDLAETSGPLSIDRDRLLRALRAYLAHQGVEANWDAIKDTGESRLITSLAMMCPFRPSEKQALLEAATLDDRARVMMALLEMALLERGDDEGRVKQ